LGRVAGQAAVPRLGAALRDDPASEVRVMCAQTLGRIRGAAGVRALAEAMPGERDVRVRIEIVHALAEQGIAEARSALDRIARDDADASVRGLAKSYRDRI
jgi:HEAT repeat protein